MDNDERIRLILELTGTSSIQEASAAFEVLERKVGEYAVAESKATHAEDAAVRAAIEHTQAQRALNLVLDETVTATNSVIVSTGGLGETLHPNGHFGRNILQGSYAIQDFTSQLGTRGLAGALSAVQNNIPGMLEGLGPPGMIGMISVLSVGVGLLYENWDKVSGLFGKTTADKLPKLTEGLEGMKAVLKDIDDKIEALEKKAKGGALDFFDNEKLDKLRGLKKEGEQRTADEKAVSGIDAFSNERGRKVQAAVKAAIAEAGGGDRVAKNLAMNTGMSGQEATAVVAGAMRGNEADLETLRKNAPTFGGRYNDVSPETEEAGDAAVIEAEEFGARAHRGSAKFRRAKQQQIDQDKRAEQLTREGLTTQNQMFADLDRDRDHDKKTAEAKAHRDAEKARHTREKYAREHTPEAINRRQQEALDNEAMGYVQRAMPGAMPGPQAAVAKHMVENYQAGLALGHTIEEQINYAVMQTRTEMTRGIQAGLKRSGQGTETRISP